MSTAVQIIAEHRWDERRGICECMFVPEFGPGTRYERMTVQEWAAHVVAALSAAGCNPECTCGCCGGERP